MSTEPLDNSHPDAPGEDLEAGHRAPLPDQAPKAPKPAPALSFMSALAVALCCAEPFFTAARASSWMGPALLGALLSGMALPGPERFNGAKAAAALTSLACLCALAWLARSGFASWEASSMAARAAAGGESLRRLFWALPAWAGLAGVGRGLPLFWLWAGLAAGGVGAILLGAPSPF